MNNHPTRQMDDLLQLIDNVYEAAFDEERWRNLAPEIARTFGSTSTTLQVQRIGASSQILTGELGVLGIHRPRSAGSYAEDDKYWVSRFLPHLQRGLRVREQLTQSARSRYT